MSAPAGRTGERDATTETRDSNRVQDEDELRPHYQFDYSKAKPNRFASRFSEDTVAVALEPDVAAVFPDAKAVNEALRLVMQLARIPRPEPSTVAEP